MLLRPLHFYSIFYIRRVWVSSGIALVGFGFRLSYARWQNRCPDSNSNSIMANPGSLWKLFARNNVRLNNRHHEIANN